MNADEFHTSLFTNHDNGSVSICSESKPSEIIAKLQQVYEKMLESIDEEAEVDALRLKVSTLQSWVRDLTEQNTLLVETAEQLEKEAAERVSLLEERIRQTSQVALKYMTKLQDYDSQVQDLAGQKINLVSMTLSQEQLQTRVSNLQNDIKNLLELIHRGRETGSWNLDDLTFKEVVWDDNLVATLSTEQLQQHVFAEQTGGKNETVPDTEVQNTVQNCQSQIILWKSKALEAEAKVKELEEDAIIKTNNLTDLQHQFAERQAHLDLTLKENEKLCSQIKVHMEQISLRDEEIEKFKKALCDMEKSSRDERAALTAEVAEKHDKIRSLTEKNKELENSCLDANMKTQLKEDIIKQMRKDIRQLKTEAEGLCICKKQTSPEMTIQVTDDKDSEKTTEIVNARIVDEQTRIHITHCIKESIPDTSEVDSLKKELSDTKEELEKMKQIQKSREQMLANQKEMLKVQQNTLDIAQTELKDTQERLKELENMKKAAEDSVKELKRKCEDEKALKVALAIAEKRNEEQQLTIKNLQEALLSTKTQLEELQGKGTMEEELKEENDKLQRTIAKLEIKVSEIQRSLDEAEQKYEKVEENSRKFQYEVSLMSQIKEISDQNNTVLTDEIKNLNAELNKLQDHLQRKDSEIRSLQLALNDEKNSVLHSKKAYGFASETLKCYLVQTESLYKMKDILQEKSKNLVSQNNILQEEISSLQKELNGANMYCNEVCREFLATVEFVHQWMLKKHTLQSRLTVNLQQKLYIIKNLRKERKCLRRTVNTLNNNVRYLKQKLYESIGRSNTSCYPCPVIKVLQSCRSSTECCIKKSGEI